MVSASALVGLLVLVAANAAVAALVTRFARFQLATRLGAVVVVLFVVPVVYVATTILVGGVLGLGDGLFGDAGQLVTVAWLVPFALGVAFDLFWMPAPAEDGVPARTGR